MYSSTANYDTSHAIVIGINHDKHVGPLRFTVNDAQEVAEVLQDKMGFKKDHGRAEMPHIASTRSHPHLHGRDSMLTFEAVVAFHLRP